MSGNNFDDPKKWPVEGGESFLADWEGAGNAQMQQGGEPKKVVIASGEDVGFEVEIQQQNPAGGVAKQTQMGAGDGYNWTPSDDLG